MVRPGRRALATMITRLSCILFSVALVLQLGVQACGSGGVDEGEGTSSAEPAPPSADQSSASGTGEQPETNAENPTSEPSACANAPVDLAASRLQRLTPTQYNATVRTLFAPAKIDDQQLQESPQTFGFRNFGQQQNPSSLVIQEFQQAALKITQQAMPQAQQWSGCPLDGGDRAEACGTQFLQRFIPRAFRRPQSSAALEPYLQFFRSELTKHNFEVALALTIQGVLQAPEFLYFIEHSQTTNNQGVEKFDAYSMASRLSYLLWDTIPDETLREAAERDELSNASQIAAQARRMLKDPRARGAIARFFHQWLDSERIHTISLDPATYPSYTPTINDVFHEGLQRRIEHSVFDSQGTLASLLTHTNTWVNPDLAPVYGVAAPSSGSWELVSLPAEQRSGLLTDAGWLASRAHAVHPSPVARGVFVLERLLCQPSYPPPADADTTPPKPDPQTPTTNRQRYEQHVLDARCAGCHKPIDGIGMGFEHYDSFGRWRDTDNGFAVDASGLLVGSGEDVPFNGAIELSTMLSQSKEVHDCVARQLFRYALARDPQDADTCQLSEQQARFTATQGHFLEQIVTLVSSPAFRHRKVAPSP